MMPGRRSVFMLCVVCLLQLTGQSAAPDPVDVFYSRIQEPFQKVQKQAIATVDAKYRPDRDKKPLSTRELYEQLEMAIIENWPYELPKPRANAETGYTESWEAYHLAQLSLRADYFDGKITREDAVAKLKKVSLDYPGTLAADAALTRAAHMYTQPPKYDKPDYDAALKLYEQVANQEGGLTVWRVKARVNMTSLSTMSKSSDEIYKPNSDMLIWLSEIQNPQTLLKSMLPHSLMKHPMIIIVVSLNLLSPHAVTRLLQVRTSFHTP